MENTNQDSEYIKELKLKIEQLEFDNKALEVQNVYMKENIKKYHLQEKISDNKNSNCLWKRLKNKVWRILNEKKH